jgi:hypothetical protein
MSEATCGYSALRVGPGYRFAHPGYACYITFGQAERDSTFEHQMTLIAVWRTENRLMTIADTRIIRSVGNVLTEHGPKILPIRIRGKQPGPSGLFDQKGFQFDIGFAYSGATLSALSAHALAGALLGNLVGQTGTPPPSMHEIANFIGGAAAEYMREVGQLNGNGGLFSAVVFGFCHATRQLRGFEIRPRLNQSPFICDIVEHDLQRNNSIVIIGSCPDLLRQRIEADRSVMIARGDTHPVLDIDRPTRALQVLIDEAADPSVGGMIQQGWATAAGFELVANMRPITPRGPSPRNAGLFVLGFDIMDVRQVGGYMVSLTGR